MAWIGLTPTVEGIKALNDAQRNGKFNFKSVAVGDGDTPGNFSTQTALVHQLYEISDLKIDLTDDGCRIIVDFPKMDFDYYFREIGIIVTTDEGDKLYVYDNCGKDADYIVVSTGNEERENRIALNLKISGVSEITVSSPSVLYVDYNEFKSVTEEIEEKKVSSNGGNISDTIVEFEKVSELTNIQSREKASTIFGKIAKAISDLISHISTEAAASVLGHVKVDAALSKTSANPVQNQAVQTALDGKLNNTGDAKDTTVTFSSGDNLSPTGWADIGLVASKETSASLMRKFSLTVKNVRYLYKMLGTTDISAIGNGTVTGALSAVNSNLGKIRIEKIATLNGGTTDDTEATIKSIKDAAILIFTYRYLGAFEVSSGMCVPKRAFTTDVIVYNYESVPSGSSKVAKVTYVSDTKVKYSITDTNWSIDIDAVFFS